MVQCLTEEESKKIIQQIVRFAGFDDFSIYEIKKDQKIFVYFSTYRKSSIAMTKKNPIIISNDKYGTSYNFFKQNIDLNENYRYKLILQSMLCKTHQGKWIMAIDIANCNERCILIEPYETIDSIRIKIDLMQ